MFSKDAPAKSIKELTLFLMSEHNNNYVYRGQTRDYGKMVPSLFRMVSLKEQFGFYVFPDDFKSKRRDVIRTTLIYTMMKKYGNIVGNYLSQQYLALSGCIDVTDKVDIASFFATMCYPDYDTTMQNQEFLGVIYRFNKSAFKNNIVPVGVKNNPFDVKAELGDTHVFLNNETVNNLSIKETVFPDDRILGIGRYYTLEENITAFGHIAPFLTQLDMNNRNFHEHLKDLTEYGLFKRAFQQYGGMIQPKYLCKMPDDETMYKPFEHTVGFEDIYGKYGMEAFYFEHANSSSKYNRREIWPSIWEDGTFATLCAIVKSLKTRVDFGDIDSIKDIVDIGYSSNTYLELNDQWPYLPH